MNVTTMVHVVHLVYRARPSFGIDDHHLLLGKAGEGLANIVSVDDIHDRLTTVSGAWCG